MESLNLNQKKSTKKISVLLSLLLCIVIVLGGWLFIKYINNGNLRIFQSGDVCDGYDITSEDFDAFKNFFSGEARESISNLYSKCEYVGGKNQDSLNIVKYKFDGCGEDQHILYITAFSGNSLPTCAPNSWIVDCAEIVDLPENMENIKEKVTITWDGEMWSEIPSCVARCIDGYNYDVEKSVCVEDKGEVNKGEIDEGEENGGEEDELLEDESEEDEEIDVD